MVNTLEEFKGRAGQEPTTESEVIGLKMTTSDTSRAVPAKENVVEAGIGIASPRGENDASVAIVRLAEPTALNKELPDGATQRSQLEPAVAFRASTQRVTIVSDRTVMEETGSPATEGAAQVRATGTI